MKSLKLKCVCYEGVIELRRMEFIRNFLEMGHKMASPAARISDVGGGGGHQNTSLVTVITPLIIVTVLFCSVGDELAL